MYSTNSQSHLKQLTILTQKEKQEKAAQDAITKDILSKLNVSLETLPQKSQQILLQAAEHQNFLKIDQLDPIALSLQHSKLISDRLEEDYEILKLKQKNAELQMKIERNKKFIDGLRKELERSRESLESQSPNPENIQEHLRQLKLKVGSYEESYDKAMTKFNNLSVPPHVYPKSLLTLAGTLAALREEAAALKQRADDVTLMRDARNTFNRLRS